MDEVVAPLPRTTLEHSRPTLGLGSYLRREYWVYVATIISLVIIFATFGWTLHIALLEMLQCPNFGQCQLPQSTVWLRNHISLIQGITTLCYTAALSCLAYTACAMFEAALWVVLTRQKLTITEVESWQAVSQMSILAIPRVAAASKSVLAWIILLLATICILAPLTGALIVGSIYELTTSPIHWQSEWNVGGGIGPIYAQNNPPSSVAGGAVSLYTAWSRNISREPLPELRDWMVNRKLLVDRGNLTAQAVRMQKQISCSGKSLQRVNIPGTSNGILEFPSRMSEQNGRGQTQKSSETVKVRTYSALTVWADSFSFVHENRTQASIVFASLNGEIEGGTVSPIDDHYIKNVSAIMCSLDIEFIDDTLKLGDPLPAPIPTLSSISQIHVGHCNSSNPIHGCDQYESGASWTLVPGNASNTLNEVLLWFCMSPILVGTAVNGTQPQFQSQRETSLMPLPYTSSDPLNNTWTLDEIHTLIDASIGAMAIESSTNFIHDHKPISLTSTIFTRRLVPSRVPQLFIVPGGMLLCVVLLGAINVSQHNKYNLPVMRGAPLREILRSMHTRYMHGFIDSDSHQWHRHGTLGDVPVKFGIEDSDREGYTVGLGNPETVRQFGSGGRRISNAAMGHAAAPVQSNENPGPARIDEDEDDDAVPMLQLDRRQVEADDGTLRMRRAPTM